MKYYQVILCMFILAILIPIMVQQELYHNDNTHKKRVDIVIARYAESIEWLCDPDIYSLISNENIDTRIFVYNKGQDDIKMCILPRHIKITYENVKNVGRCDHTYLYHIIKHYDNLGDVTMFLPGSATLENKIARVKFSFRKVYSDFDSVFVCVKHDDVREELGDFYLNEWLSSNSDNSKINSDSSMLKSNIRPFGEWYDHIFGDLKIQHICYLGILCVSRSAIRNRDVDFYDNIISYVNTHNNPEAGHYIERSWIAIFHPVDESRMFLDLYE